MSPGADGRKRSALACALVAGLLTSCGQGDKPTESQEQMIMEEVLLSWVSQDLGRGLLTQEGQRAIEPTTLAPSKRRQLDSSPLPCLDMGPHASLELSVQADHKDL